MSDELTKLLQRKPDEVTKQLLSDVFKKGKLSPWSSLITVKSHFESSNDHPSLDSSLLAVLTLFLEQMKQSNPIHADILYGIYWQRKQTKIVAQHFNHKNGYSPDSGTFYNWLRAARYQFGTILLEHENQSRANNQARSKSAQDKVVSTQPLNQEHHSTTLTTLAPLEREQRYQTRNAKAISTLGITLFRLLPAFQYEFLEMLNNGGQLRVLVVDHQSTAIEMASMRSDSGTPIKTQIRRVEDMLELLTRWKLKIPNANIEVRLLNFPPPYGITIIYPRLDTERASCLVRLLTFRTSTSTAPTVKPDPINEAYWFEFFCDQFEKMWEFARRYDLSTPANNTGQ